MKFISLYEYFQNCTEKDVPNLKDYLDGAFFSEECPNLSKFYAKELRKQEKSGNFDVIMVSMEMSTWAGGDDVIEIVDRTIKSIKDGFQIFTWYGPDTEVLIFGVKSFMVDQNGYMAFEDEN